MFYDDIKKVCKEKNISLSKLALEIGVPTKDTLDWERGTKPSPGVIEKIATFFGEPKETLFPRLRFVESSFLHKIPEDYAQMHPTKLLKFANDKIEGLCGILESNELNAIEAKTILLRLSESLDNTESDFQTMITDAIRFIDEIAGA